jgi:preprotein translocase subunit SecG
MENVVLTIHLILALLLVGVVLLQRSEGGGLGMGGGGSMQARPAVSGLAKITWGLAAAFIVTSISLTVIATRGGEGGSVVDQLPAADATVPAPDAGNLLTPAPVTDAPAVPQKAEN